MGDGENAPLRLQFNPKVRLEFHGSTITSDAGLLAFREFDDALGLTEIAEDYLQESRTGRNILHHLVPLLRQSIYSRLAGYDDTNDAVRLSQDPAMRVIVGWQGSERKGASTSEMDLDPENDMFMVMTGDWSDVITGLRTEGAEGYQPSWQIPESHQDEIGRYLGKPIFIQRSQEERHLYLIDTKQWGHFVRKQFEGDQDLSIQVAAISEERARELLQENPLHFGQEPDEASKIRKLRTLVQVDVRTRTQFQVKDPTGARHIVGAKQVAREPRE